MELDQRSLLEEAADAGVLAYPMKPVREFEHKIRDKRAIEVISR